MPAPRVAGGGGGETRDMHSGGPARATLDLGASGLLTSPKVKATQGLGVSLPCLECDLSVGPSDSIMMCLGLVSLTGPCSRPV